MNRRLFSLVPGIVPLLIFLLGCQAASVGRKGNAFREQVIALYEEQALDNLIRAYNYRPIVQLDYRDLLVQGTDTLGGKTDFTLTDATNNLSRVFGIGANGQRQSQLSFRADPVADHAVYNAYMCFARDPELFQATHCSPPCSCHIVRECNGVYYWIPASAAPMFWDLVMSTSLMRSAPPIPAALQRHIVEVKDIEDGDEGSVNATLVFDEPVPRGAATAIATLDDGRKVRLKLTPVEGQVDDDDSPIAEGGRVEELRVNWRPESDHFTAINLIGAKVNVYSEDYPPEAPLPDSTPQRILDTLDQIRANQSLFSPPQL